MPNSVDTVKPCDTCHAMVSVDTTHLDSAKGRQAKSLSRDFRHVLQDQLSARCAKNPNYSLRSFAKFLEISPSALSAIIRSKRSVTEKMKERLGLKLGLSIEQLENLKANPHGNRRLEKGSKPAPRFEPIAVDTFSIISDPVHYALLELIKTEDFQWDFRWIAKRLQKTVSELQICIERLERVGLLARRDDGELYDTTAGFTTDIREGLTSEAQRQFQVRSLEDSIRHVQTVPHQLRDNTSITMAINIEDLPLAKKMIKEFRQKLCAELESNSTLNEVYQMTISLVPCTHPQGDAK